VVVDAGAQTSVVEDAPRRHLESVPARVERAERPLDHVERQTLLFCIAFWSAVGAIAVHLLL
jgi:hypothetical protein